jgi:hypothetical protein
MSTCGSSIVWRDLPRIEGADLLDEVIDPLADYVAAGVVPSQQAEVQLVKRKRHEEALQR